MSIADRLADPAESVAYARQVLGKALRDRSDYRSRVVPIVDPTPSGHRAQFVENQDDGQPE
ncbi:MAG: hypothetical protein CME34_19645 [Gordonia sp.]|nr:hypothetical protein [Gordonia sp. (in: high G+C Gram-positive bacteria)]